MIGGRVARHSIGVVRAPATPNGRGGTNYDWPNATVTPIHGWSVDAGDTTQDTSNRDGWEVTYTVRGPLSADVRPSDRVEVLGQRYDVLGGVLRQPGPSARTSHTILRIGKSIG